MNALSTRLHSSSTLSISLRYGLRSLRANLRRTLLSIVGVAVGVGLGLVSIAWTRGQEPLFVGMAVSGGIGHLRIAPRGWNAQRDETLRLGADWPRRLRELRADPAVKVATPRVRTGAVLALGTRSAGVELVGVDPETERRATRYVRTVAQGRYLEANERGALVVGRALLETLDARLEDELFVTAVDEAGEIQAAVLRVVGVVETGSRDVDLTIAHVAIGELEALTRREGISEITMVLEDSNGLESTQASMAQRLGPQEELLSWHVLAPELSQSLRSNDAFNTLVVGTLLLVVLLGVASAQLTGVLERRRELAVLAALGMNRVRLVTTVMIEGVVLGLGAGLLALLWTSPVLRSLHETGVDLQHLYQNQEAVAVGGVVMDMVLYPAFGSWLIAGALVLSTLATTLASLYPAVFASRTDPAAALRVDP